MKSTKIYSLDTSFFLTFNFEGKIQKKRSYKVGWPGIKKRGKIFVFNNLKIRNKEAVSSCVQNNSNGETPFLFVRGNVSQPPKTPRLHTVITRKV